MSAFSGHISLSQHGNCAEQIAEMQRAIGENTRRLKEIRQKRRCAEEEIIQWQLLKECSKEAYPGPRNTILGPPKSFNVAETRRRVDLTMGKDAVVLALMELGQVLQEERQLSEQLNGQASADRKQRIDLQERMEGITNKGRSLAAEIREVKEHLAEAKARNMTAQALIQAPSGKSKRKAKSKPK